MSELIDNNRPNIWFMMPSVDVPTGGINNCYRLCSLAEELGIQARVLSERQYMFCDPIENSKYWVKSNPELSVLTFDIDEVKPGDLVVQTEVYTARFHFRVPVRRIIYVQNWSLMNECDGWENHIWVYNNWTHLTYCIESFMYTAYEPRTKLPSWRPVDWTDTAKMVKKNKLKWSCVTPFFDVDKFEPGVNNQSKVMVMPRRLAGNMDLFKENFGDNLVIVDNISPEELRLLYREVGILVLPSPAEGLSFPMIEALLSGCAVVSWECGAPEEYLIHEETAMMAEFGNVNELIEHTQFLLNNPQEQRRLSENGRNLVKKLYNRERTLTELYVSYHAAQKINADL
jgi:hypothetical protein